MGLGRSPSWRIVALQTMTLATLVLGIQALRNNRAQPTEDRVRSVSVETGVLYPAPSTPDGHSGNAHKEQLESRLYTLDGEAAGNGARLVKYGDVIDALKARCSDDGFNRLTAQPSRDRPIE